MLIKKFLLENFRNYQSESVELIPGINNFTGQNGQGKTNLLEGINYLLTGKSYRVQREQELLRWGQSSFHLYGTFLIMNRAVRLESHYQDQRKIVKINSVPCRKLSEYVGTVNAIYFSPDDLVMIKGGPLERRRFLDLHIAQLRPGYISLLNSYNKILQQKRAILKSNSAEESKCLQLRLWNEQLVQIGARVMENRWQFANELKGIAYKIYKNLSHQQEDLEIDYLALSQKNVADAISLLPILLEEKMNQEIERQAVLVGPHRDDLQIILNGKSARLFASQGQQRSIVLSLKLAEIEIIRKSKGEYPILLLDDVLSELDQFRRKYLMEFINSTGIQTLITMTSADEVQVDAGLMFQVDQGRVRRY